MAKKHVLVPTVGLALDGGDANDEKHRKGQPVYVDLMALGEDIVGKRIAYYRKSLDLSQAEVARRAGISQMDVSRLESNPKNSRLRTFISVCEVLNKTLADILEDSPEVVSD